MTWVILKGRSVRGRNFPTHLRDYARTVWPRMTNFGTVIQVREKHISKGRNSFHWRDQTRTARMFFKCTHSALDWSYFKSLRNHYHKLILSAKNHFKGSGAPAAPIFRTTYMRPPPTHTQYEMRNNNQIIYGDQTRCEANVYTVATNADARSVCDS